MTALEQKEDQMKSKLLAMGFVAISILGSTSAFAAGNSTPGGDRYTNNPGRQQATDVGAQCGTGAGSGAFGFLGKDNNPGDPTWDGGNGTDPGTSGQQTGASNSGECGHNN